MTCASLQQRRRRRGLSLLETIVATAIFVAAIAAIGALLDNGLNSVRINDLATIALLRCESKMEEVVAGIEAIPEETSLTAAATPYEDDPRWQYRIVSEPTNVAKLLRVTVVVEYREDPADTTNEEPDFAETLVRLVVDPAARGLSSPEEEEERQPVQIRELLGLGSSDQGGSE